MRVVAGLVLLLSLGTSLVALADGDPPFRRTTPRGSFGRDGPVLVVGVPGGRAWGIESGLIPVPAIGTAMHVTMSVEDPAVREAFVRIAWYDRATGRPKQFAIADATFVHADQTATFDVPLDPPAGAVAYRVRVLARLHTPDAISSAAAIRAVLSSPFASTRAMPPTRLLP
jgi:hypothetical protein